MGRVAGWRREVAGGAMGTGRAWEGSHKKGLGGGGPRLVMVRKRVVEVGDWRCGSGSRAGYWRLRDSLC